MKLNNIKDRALRFTIGTVVDDVVKNYKKDPEKVSENLIQLNNIARKYFNRYCQKR